MGRFTLLRYLSEFLTKSFVDFIIGNSIIVTLRRTGHLSTESACPPLVLYLSYHATTTSERRAGKQCQRRGASSGQKTKRGIEGEDPAAAGIKKLCSLKGPQEENTVRASFLITV